MELLGHNRARIMNNCLHGNRTNAIFWFVYHFDLLLFWCVFSCGLNMRRLHEQNLERGNGFLI